MQVGSTLKQQNEQMHTNSKMVQLISRTIMAKQNTQHDQHTKNQGIWTSLIMANKFHKAR